MKTKLACLLLTLSLIFTLAVLAYSQDSGIADHEGNKDSRVASTGGFEMKRARNITMAVSLSLLAIPFMAVLFAQQLPAPHQAKLQDVKDLAFDCSLRERMLQLDQADLVAKIAALEKELAALKKEKP